MDRLLGSIIDDYTLYNIFEGIMMILSLVIIYLGIQIALTWKFIKKEEANSSGAEKNGFYRSSIFIFIAGFFMLIHEFLEGLEKNAPDFVTYEFFELIALLALVLFLYELHKTMKKSKRRHLDPLLPSRLP